MTTFQEVFEALLKKVPEGCFIMGTKFTRPDGMIATTRMCEMHGVPTEVALGMAAALAEVSGKVIHIYLLGKHDHEKISHGVPFATLGAGGEAEIRAAMEESPAPPINPEHQ